jgi:hypothetical protein
MKSSNFQVRSAGPDSYSRLVEGPLAKLVGAEFAETLRAAVSDGFSARLPRQNVIKGR